MRKFGTKKGTAAALRKHQSEINNNNQNQVSSSTYPCALSLPFSVITIRSACILVTIFDLYFKYLFPSNCTNGIKCEWRC